MKQVDRGGKANALMGSEIYQEAFRQVEEGILQKWKDAPVRDLEGQQSLKLMHKLLADVKSYIEGVAEDGKMAAFTLEHERTLAHKAKKMFGL